MTRRFIRNIFISTFLFSVFSASLQLVPATVAADPAPTATPAASTCPTGSGVQGTSKNQVFGGINETTTDCGAQSGQTAIQVTVSVLSWVVGILGVIMIIASGFQYVTSGGDSNKVSGAKRTLIYALIGLAIAALAQFLVHFVINKAASS